MDAEPGTNVVVEALAASVFGFPLGEIGFEVVQVNMELLGALVGVLMGFV